MAERSGGASAALARFDWPAAEAALDAHGFAVLPGLLDADDCAALVALYADERRFRNRVVMERHAYGRGEYQYFAYPLPPLVAELRAALYERLLPTAQRWRALLREPADLPATLDGYLERCHAAGQKRPTPLLLRYEADGYNCLHRDLYGEWVFPLQVTVLLSEPVRDFAGGEFLLVEQRPRAQSAAEVVPLRQGDAVAFAVQHRPRRGARGQHRAQLRHGVSRIRSGLRFALGIIFHDAT